MSNPLADYALIGDTHSTALIASTGSIDWLCWPRHDSPALLTRLLDDAVGGAATVTIAGTQAARRSYSGDTNILETTFIAAGGEARLTDFMPIHEPSTMADDAPDGAAQSRLVRIITCVNGEISGVFRLRVTPDYGREVAQRSRHGERWRLDAPSLRLELSGSGLIEADGDGLSLSFSLKADEQAFIALSFLGEAPAGPLGDMLSVAESLRRTKDYWEHWCEKIVYDGPYRHAVVRSALVLKMLTYSPTGGIVAAATTSLPEAIPGNRNYDYRYSWVRDASFTVTAFCNLGLIREARDYLRFLRRADQSQGKDLKLVYGIDGDVPPETELPHLSGWRNAGPVRIGNLALGQRQHDIYGEFLIALHTYLAAVDYQPTDMSVEETVAAITVLADHAMRCKNEPDCGIWEFRTEPQHLQHSKALLWVALDRAVKTADHLEGFSKEKVLQWHSAADALRQEYERETWNGKRGAYMQAYGSHVLDAAVLRTVLFGALDPKDERTRATLRAIERELTVGDLTYRYRMDDGLEGHEATFTACAFWRVGAMALTGWTRSAQELFERLLLRGNDLGLFAEEIDATTGEQRGNLPQAFTHMCVINHAVRLRDCIEKFGLVERPNAPDDGA